VIYYVFMALFLAAVVIWICVAIKEERGSRESASQDDEQ